jgi:hypothetical protein
MQMAGMRPGMLPPGFNPQVAMANPAIASMMQQNPAFANIMLQQQFLQQQMALQQQVRGCLSGTRGRPGAGVLGKLVGLDTRAPSLGSNPGLSTPV